MITELGKSNNFLLKIKSEESYSCAHPTVVYLLHKLKSQWKINVIWHKQFKAALLKTMENVNMNNCCVYLFLIELQFGV